jgi:hypothetical protein
MNKLMDNLFGPFPKEYCLYFYFLEIFAFIALIITIITVVTSYKSFKNKAILFVLLLQPLILYFESRLLYSMCVGSLSTTTNSGNLMS